jgi:hypothetical protein
MLRAEEQTEGFVFQFSNEKPIAADDLGRLFISLAQDYRKLTGRRLVVTSVVVGSLRAVLMDAAIAAGPYLANAAEVAKAISSMIGFTTALKDRFNSAHTLVAREGKKSAAEASLDKFLKVVERSGGKGQFTFKSGRDEIKVSVTSGEAIKIRKQLAVQRAARLPSPEKIAALPFGGGTEGIVDHLAAISESDVERVIPVLVEILRSKGFEGELSAIADELDVRGYGSVAQAVREEMRQSNGRFLLPIAHE